MALALSTVFFAARIKALGWDLKAGGKPVGNIAALGWHTVVGGFIFGIGAVISGGCASGTLMRMGEGFIQQWIAIVFFIIGSVLGGPVLGWFKIGKPVHLPQALGGWIPAFIVQFGVLFALYILADWYGRKKAGNN